jgi:hypothetical protein
MPVTPHWKRQHDLMDEMMLNVGIEILAAVNRGGFVSARASCRACGDFAACREWLLEGCASVRQPPKFCPNLNFFTSLKD